MSGERELLIEMYRDFNDRKMESVLAHLHPEVEWPNGMEAGFVYGREGVRAYWTRQWAMMDPRVQPVSIQEDGAGRHAVEVHQVVQDLEGNVLMDKMLRHLYRIEDGLITRMDIEE